MYATLMSRPEIARMPSAEYAQRHSATIKADLSLNVNPYGASPRAIQRLAALPRELIYQYQMDNDALIENIATYSGVRVAQVMLGDGCDGCLEMVAHTFINKGDVVAIPIPTFHRYEFHTKLMGGEPRFIPTDDLLFTEDTISHIPKQAKLLFLCNPNNPTGQEIALPLLKQILDHFPGIVVIDEALADARGINSVSLLTDHENLIIVRSFSKIFGLASLRIGYIIAHESMLEQIRKVSSPFKVNGIAQDLALEVLQDREHHERSLTYIKDSREYLIGSLTQMGFACTPSTTTNFLVDIGALGSSPDVTERLKQRGIAVTDASVFRVPVPRYIRVSVASPAENEYFLDVMREFTCR